MSTSERSTSGWRRLRRPAVVVPVALALGVVLVVGLALFQPWKLWVDDVVDEALPMAMTLPLEPTFVPPAGSTPKPTPTRTTSDPQVLAAGSFISHEHSTSGSVRVLRLADGSRVLRIEDLDTSNGPDLRVWITDAPVRSGRAGWFVFDDGRYVELGRLKGNKGSQNYALPAGVDLAELDSVTIWCDRFNVSFGAAALR